MPHRLKFAKNLVTLLHFWEFLSYATQVKVCKKFGDFAPFLYVFSYATRVKVCKKFGDCLLHFWEGFLKSCIPSKKNLMFAKNLVTFCSMFGSFFLCYTGNTLQKIGWLCSIFGSFFLMLQNKSLKKFGDCLLHFREIFFMLHR